jgi:hypothetical protein
MNYHQEQPDETSELSLSAQSFLSTIHPNIEYMWWHDAPFYDELISAGYIEKVHHKSNREGFRLTELGIARYYFRIL